MDARAKFLGHAIHQMLIVLPLGLLTGVVIFDVVYLVVGGQQWATVSYWLIPAGVLGGLVAALFGFADWTKIPSDTRAKRLGGVHGIGNVIVLALFSTSWWLRGDAAADPGVLAFACSFVGCGVALVTGWMGGELVDRLGVGVDAGAHVNAPSSLSGQSATEGLRRARGVR